jgi:hypothetical protein
MQTDGAINPENHGELLIDRLAGVRADAPAR